MSLLEELLKSEQEDRKKRDISHKRRQAGLRRHEIMREQEKMKAPFIFGILRKGTPSQ